MSTCTKEVESPEYRTIHEARLLERLRKVRVPLAAARKFAASLPAGELTLIEFPDIAGRNVFNWIEGQLEHARKRAIQSALCWGEFMGRKAIAQYLRLRGITVHDLSVGIGAKKSVVAIWLSSASHVVQPHTIEKIAAYLGLTIDDVNLLMYCPKNATGE